MGIVNGTTNYILDQMTTTGARFDEALAQAKAQGYAEADPTADVEVMTLRLRLRCCRRLRSILSCAATRCIEKGLPRSPQMTSSLHMIWIASSSS